MRPSRPRILFTDLDGTLLNSRKEVSPANLAALEALGAADIVRVIATGRSLYSFNRVIPQTFPADFVIFSSGAGIVDMRTRELLFSAHLSRRDVQTISMALDSHGADHMIHYQVPENHRFLYRRHSKDNPDFERRVSLYSHFAEDIADTTSLPARSAQVIAVLPPDDERFPAIKAELNGFHVIRTTSPLDHRSVWLEVYPIGIHKGAGAAWLCRRLHIESDDTVGIGNDYNDIDLLDFTAKSYIVGNSPKELQRSYTPTMACDDDGFCAAVTAAVGLTGK